MANESGKRETAASMRCSYWDPRSDQVETAGVVVPVEYEEGEDREAIAARATLEAAEIIVWWTKYLNEWVDRKRKPALVKNVEVKRELPN